MNNITTKLQNSFATEIMGDTIIRTLTYNGNTYIDKQIKDAPGIYVLETDSIEEQLDLEVVITDGHLLEEIKECLMY